MPAKKPEFTPVQPVPAREGTPVSEPAPVQAPVPAAEPAVPAASAAWPGWPVLRDALQPDIGMGDYVFLSNPDMVGGCLTDDKLTLWACNEFIKGMIDKQAILEKVARKAAQLAGRPVRDEVKVGQAPAESLQPGPAADDGEFDALEVFLAEGHDNLIVE